MKWRLLVVGLAAAALVAPIPPSLIERHYSSAAFPALQHAVTAASNRTATPWFDILLVLVVAAVVLASARDFMTRGLVRGGARIVIRVITVASFVYLAFLILWGFNYRREPLRTKIRFDASRITADAAGALARQTAAAMNAQHDAAHAAGWTAAGKTDTALAQTFASTAASLRLPSGTVPGRPKYSLLDLYFRRAGVAGMTDPFFLETLVASDLLPFERPHVVAHEWAHLAGITDEGEANFVGWLTCVRGSVAHSYSGWLFLYSEVLDDVPRDAAREVSASLQPGPRADLLAIRERYQREVSPRISGAGWHVYDQYLKANRIEAGAASYGQVVQLILGTELR